MRGVDIDTYQALPKDERDALDAWATACDPTFPDSHWIGFYIADDGSIVVRAVDHEAADRGEFGPNGDTFPIREFTVQPPYSPPVLVDLAETS